jgi:hypothetical protein
MCYLDEIALKGAEYAWMRTVNVLFGRERNLIYGISKSPVAKNRKQEVYCNRPVGIPIHILPSSSSLASAVLIAQRTKK